MPVNVLPLPTIGRILQGGQDICREAGIPIAGGHTIDSVEPIYGLVVMGLVHPSRIKRNSQARVGDVLILGKPLGVGVLSAALKKEQLSAQGYADMVRYTTQLNRPGTALAAMDGVHAMTDVTGFGLAGHALELARGAQCQVNLRWVDVPLIEGVQALAEQGMVTGASGRNWASYGAEVHLPAGFSATAQALLSDPQTSGGLLVSCAPETAHDVLATFQSMGFAQAAVVGHISAGSGVHIQG
jgi:selenide,water dikinase